MNRRGFIRMLVAGSVTASLPWKSIAKAINPIAPKIAADINLSLDEILSETLRKCEAQIIENIFAQNSFLDYIRNKTRNELNA